MNDTMNYNMDFLDDYPSLENMSFALTDNSNNNNINNNNNNSEKKPIPDSYPNKGEVRWLDSEADLYLKYWRMGFRLLDDAYNEYSSKSAWKKGQTLDEYDRWYLTAKNILDIDLDFIRPKDYEKLNKIYNPTSSSMASSAFSNSPSSDMFFDDSIDNYELESNILQRSVFDFDENLDFLSAFKATNFVVKNGKIEFPPNANINNSSNNSNSTKKRKASDKPRKRSTKVAKTSPGQNPGELSSMPVFVSTSSPSLSITSNSPDHGSYLTDSSLTKSGEKLGLGSASGMVVGGAGASAGTVKRPKVLSNRRQMFICEFPGCNYQSDRNFNFLRHKRTHGRIKGDTRKSNISQRFVLEGEEFHPVTETNTIRVKPCEAAIIANPSTITLNERLHIEETDQSIAYESDEYIERDLIIRDLGINHLNLLPSDSHTKHTFAHIAIQQPFMS